MNEASFERKRMEAVLRRHGFHFQKKYGQNFLSDPGILDEIVEAAGVGVEDYALEIGPGMGTLTAKLAQKAGQVLAVEIDKALIPILEEQLEQYKNVEILQGDITKMSLLEILEERTEGRTIRVVANLPYYITTPILMMLLEGSVPYETITVMVQKEVAERMTAGPGTKAYGALSLAVQYRTKAAVDFILEPQAFYPPPKVQSAVITLRRYHEPPVEVEDEGLLFALIRAAFNQRRKTLVNALGNAGILPMTRGELTEVVEGLGHSPTIRGEALSLEEFAALTNAVAKAAPA